MSFADPQSVKIGASEISLPRVETGELISSYLSADGATRYTISSQEKKRKRHVLRLDVEKITPDPFIPAQNTTVSMSVYLTIDRPIAGYTNEEAAEVVKGLIEALSASSFKAITKVLSFES